MSTPRSIPRGIPQILPFILIAALSGLAQSPEVSIETPKPPRFVGPILKPFHLEKRRVSPARLEDSPRLDALVRSGNLYLGAQDVIALALENNLDIAIQRYGPFLAREVLRRAGVRQHSAPRSTARFWKGRRA